MFALSTLFADSITALQVEVAEQERLREERRRAKRLLKAQKAELEAKGAKGGGLFGPSAGIVGMGEGAATGGKVDNRDIIAGRSLPVNLGEELHGSLRQLRTQGSVLLDKVRYVCCVYSWIRSPRLFFGVTRWLGSREGDDGMMNKFSVQHHELGELNER